MTIPIPSPSWVEQVPRYAVNVDGPTGLVRFDRDEQGLLLRLEDVRLAFARLQADRDHYKALHDCDKQDSEFLDRLEVDYGDIRRGAHQLAASARALTVLKERLDALGRCSEPETLAEVSAVMPHLHAVVEAARVLLAAREGPSATWVEARNQ